MGAAGFVLVGGQSRRMGRNKALLPWGSGVLAQYTASLVNAAAGCAFLIGDPALYNGLGYPCIPDQRPGLGPLSGIETALASQQAEQNLILACDIPDASTEHLAALLREDAACTVTLDETGRVHPLCAVYRKSCLPRVSAAIDLGQLRLLDLVEQLKPAVVRYPGVLRNINTLEDLASAR